MERIIAIIPARSGSKGIKDKNIKLLNGKPLMAYTIEAAIKSGVFTDVLVSTDSLKYKEIAEQYGAWVPFLRTDDLSKDETSANDVIVDVLNTLKQIGKEYDSFMFLQPTSPLRDEKDIKKAVEIFCEKSANAVVSMCECENSPLLTRKLNENMCLDGFLSDLDKVRRQDLGKYYRLNGAIYMAKVDYFLSHKDFYKKNSHAYIMEKRKSIDIDDMDDLKLAEIYIKENIVDV